MKKNSRLMLPITRRKRGEKGLTLVELIIVMAILGLFITSLFSVFKNSLDAWKKSEARLAVYQNARAALDQMTRDIQPAIFDPANGIYAKGYEKGGGIKSGSAADEFFFVAVIDGAGDANLAEIGYWIDGSNVLRRHYDVAEKGEMPALDFDFTTPDSTTNTDDELAFNITDLQFKFHYRTENGWVVTSDGNWDAEEDNGANYTSDGIAQNPDGLPNGVEIEITVVDPTEKEEQKFSTLICIPNAK